MVSVPRKGERCASEPVVVLARQRQELLRTLLLLALRPALPHGVGNPFAAFGRQAALPFSGCRRGFMGNLWAARAPLGLFTSQQGASLLQLCNFNIDFLY